MVVIMTVLRSSYDAFDAADNATGYSSDHAANRSANRTGGAPTFSRASLATLDNALSLCGEGHRKSDKKASGYDQPVFHKQTPFPGCGRKLALQTCNKSNLIRRSDRRNSFGNYSS